MSHRQPKLLAIAVVLSLVLAALPAAAQGRPAPARPAARSAVQAPHWLAVTWSLLTALWSGEPATWLTTIRGQEGGSLDPDGKPAHVTTSTTIPILDDEGASLDPDGARR